MPLQRSTRVNKISVNKFQIWYKENKMRNVELGGGGGGPRRDKMRNVELSGVIKYETLNLVGGNKIRNVEFGRG